MLDILTKSEKKIILLAIMKYGKISAPFLQRKFKWTYEKSLDVLKLVTPKND